MTAQKLPLIEKSTLTPTVLIAGGAGFIGAALTETLLRQKARVVIIDNFSTGKKTNLERHLRDPHLLLIEHDLNEGLPENIKSLDYIVHLAGQETYLKSKPEVILDSLLTNSLGTKALLDLTRRAKAKFLLASSVEVYRGLLSPFNLDHYFGPSEEEERLFSHLEAKRFAEALVWEYYQRYDLDVRIVRLPEIYGPGMSLQSGASLGRLLEQVLAQEDLVVHGEGLEKEYYLYLDDAISGLVKALFSPQTAGSIVPLCPPESITTLELTYLVKSFASKETGVQFKPALREVEFPEIKIIGTESQDEIGWEPRVDLKTGLAKTLESFAYSPPASQAVKAAKIPLFPFQLPPLNLKPKKKSSLGQTLKKRLKLLDTRISGRLVRPKSQKKTSSHKRQPASPFRLIKSAALGLAIVVLWFTIVGPVWGLSKNIQKGYHDLTQMRALLLEGDLEGAAVLGKTAASAFEKAKDSASRLVWLANLTNQESVLKTTENGLSVASYTSWAAHYLSQAVAPLMRAIPTYPPQTGGPPLTESQVAESTVLLEKAFEYLQLGETSFNILNLEALPKNLKDKIQPAAASLGELRQSADIGRALLASLPEVLGYRQTRTYLVVFQNSNELRATGGFIGSYALLQLHQGQITNLQIDDVYNVDGLLDEKGLSQTPPTPLTQYQQVTNLRLRDANWWPDFPTSAEKIKSLYFLATNKEVDGVIALDLGFVKNLLELTGPIYLAQYQETISADNLYERAQYHSEANYFEGSPQKKSFLSDLGSQVLEQVFSLDKGRYPSLLTMWQESLQEKHLLIDFPPGPLAALLAKKGWDGSVRPTSGDYLYLVDSNVGATKTNLQIQRQIDYTVKNINREGALEGNLTIRYQHTGTTTTWPQGPYTNYLRLFVPYGTQLQKVSLTGTQLEKKSQEITPEVVVGSEAGKSYWAYPFTLDPGKTLNLNFVYQLPTDRIAIKPTTRFYTLLVQKQPGTEADGFTLNFYPPFGKTEETPPEGFDNSGEVWKTSRSLDRDLEITIPLLHP